MRCKRSRALPRRELWRSIQRRAYDNGTRSTAEPSISTTKGVIPDMNRARIYILAAVAIIWASAFSPTRAKAAQKASDATNLHQMNHAIVQGGTKAPGEGRASQV